MEINFEMYRNRHFVNRTFLQWQFLMITNLMSVTLNTRAAHYFCFTENAQTAEMKRIRFIIIRSIGVQLLVFLSCHLLTRLLKPQDFSSFSVYWVVCRCLAQNTTLHRIICYKPRPNECISVCECSYLLYMLFPLCVLFLFDYYYLLFNF